VIKINASFLIRTKIIKDESLTSYIQRVASDNLLLTADVWKLLCYSPYKNHQNTVSSYIDVNPYKALDLHKLETMLLQKSNSLYSLTLVPALEKLNISSYNANKNTIGRNIFYTYRKYCPECLNENNHYKLIWQLSSIKFCKLHNIKLLAQCWNCKKNINLLPLNGEIGICPYCNIPLSKGYSTNYSPNKTDLFNYDNWEYLLDSSKKANDLTSNYEPYSNLLLKLLYLLKDTHNYKSENTLLNLYKSLEKYSNLVYIHSIINILKKTNTSFEYFINLEVPTDFIESVVEA
jgi:hypothetical protein